MTLMPNPLSHPMITNKNSMKNYIIYLLLAIFFISSPSDLQAQFFKKLQKKIDAKIDQVINPEEKKSEGNDEQIAGNTSNKYDDNYRSYDDFVTGDTTIFFDDLSGIEVINQHPSKWRTTYSNDKDDSEINEYEGGKVIRLGSRQGISPNMTKNKDDYLTDNFTLEFDASFSANSLDQRYYIAFFEIENQNDFVEHEVRGNEITFTTFGVTDDLTEGTLNGADFFQESPIPVWRHIALTYKNNEFEIYYDGQHIFHKGDIKGNLIGITIGRSEFGTNDRYLKNILIATNN